MDLGFHLADSESEIIRVIDFLRKHPLDYKGYFGWLERTESEFFYGLKRVVIGSSEGNLVSSLVFQPHKNLNGFCELKNARVDSNFQRRLFFSFMLRQAEIFARQQGYVAMIGDVRSNRLGVVNVLRMGYYQEIAREDIYKEGVEDIIFAKPLQGNLKNSFFSIN